MNLKYKFKELHPDTFFLENNLNSIRGYLKHKKWLLKNEKLEKIEKPGEGNMNFVLRVITNQRSFILKQARPWVEKFPQIAAPINRIEVEATFFQYVGGIEKIEKYSPKCLEFDIENYVLLLEDLGESADFSIIYQQEQQLSQADIRALMDYLSVLHHLTVPKGFPSNIEMRKLNHEHIFNFPFLMDNDFNLDEVQEGLQSAALIYKNDILLKEKIKACGKIYLTNEGKHLIHGDFYPGSWLKVGTNIRIIDPEFGFIGPAEFDLAVFIAHIFMAKQEKTTIEAILVHYQKTINFREDLFAKLVGIEILRRLIGIAQLPLCLNLLEKKALMQQAAKWIVSEKLEF